MAFTHFCLSTPELKILISVKKNINIYYSEDLYEELQVKAAGIGDISSRKLY